MQDEDEVGGHAVQVRIEEGRVDEGVQRSIESRGGREVLICIGREGE